MSALAKRAVACTGFEWHQERGGGGILGLLRSEGWVARHVSPGRIVACRIVGTLAPAEGWQFATVEGELRAIGVRWP